MIKIIPLEKHQTKILNCMTDFLAVLDLSQLGFRCHLPLEKANLKLYAGHLNSFDLNFLDQQLQLRVLEKVKNHY